MLNTSSELCQALKSANKHKKLGQVYDRFAARLNDAQTAVPFTGRNVAAKAKSLCSLWRSVDTEVAKPRSKETATRDVNNKKGTLCTRSADTV